MSPGWIVGLTVASIFGYMLLFALLLSLFVSLTNGFKQGSVIIRLVLLIPLILIGSVFLVLDIIHTLLTIWLGVQALSGFRSWWHRTN